MEVTGFVEEIGLRTTVVRSLNGDRNYVPNSQIIGAVRSPRGYRTYTIEIVTTEPDAARDAVESAALRAPTGRARFLRAPAVTEERELGEGASLVRASADVPPSLEWLAEGLLDALIRAQIAPDALLAGPSSTRSTRRRSSATSAASSSADPSKRSRTDEEPIYEAAAPASDRLFDG